MPNSDTFSIPVIADLLGRWLEPGMEIVDPFARNSLIGTVRNDLDHNTAATFHMLADVFCGQMKDRGVQADAVLFDPPYSPRQISDCYKSVGMAVGQEETQNGRYYKSVRDGLDAILKPGGLALSFGWNSAGFGRERGYEIREILLVAHGGAHNDTICVVEQKVQGRLFTE